MGFDRVTIINVRPPTHGDLNTELQWLGAALGLFGDRDKDSSCFRVFVTLVRASRAGQGVSSDEIASQTALSRGTVVHHLNKLRDAGLVTSVHQGYGLHGDGLAESIERLQAELSETLNMFAAVARDIDKKLR